MHIIMEGIKIAIIMHFKASKEKVIFIYSTGHRDSFLNLNEKFISHLCMVFVANVDLWI